jgi:hypothetical protein
MSSQPIGSPKVLDGAIAIALRSRRDALVRAAGGDGCQRRYAMFALAALLEMDRPT